MSLLQSLDAEVNSALESMTVEMVLLLIDKWGRDIQQSEMIGDPTLYDLLDHYVRLKISFHKIQRAWHNGWSSLTSEQFATKAIKLSGAIKEARRKYYVAKFRYEGEHDFGCACRGCRAIGHIQH